MVLDSHGLWILLAFLAGSLPISVWIGRFVLGVDVRSVGDGNPGATNVYRAGGRTAAAIALLLDFLKGALPVGLAAYDAEVTFPWLALVALAPVAGHAFSPFLKGRGGKAVAVTFGIWAGLTAWEGPIVLGVGLLAGAKLLGATGWAVVVALVLLGMYLASAPVWPASLALRLQTAWLLLVLLGNLLITIWRHRADLAHFPGPFTK